MLGWNQCGECADESIENANPAKPRELQRQRVRPANLRLELHLMERRRQPFHPGRRGVTEINTRFVTTHENIVDAEASAEHDVGGRSDPQGVTGDLAATLGLQSSAAEGVMEGEEQVEGRFGTVRRASRRPMNEGGRVP